MTIKLYDGVVQCIKCGHIAAYHNRSGCWVGGQGLDPLCKCPGLYTAGTWISRLLEQIKLIDMRNDHEL